MEVFHLIYKISFVLYKNDCYVSLYGYCPRSQVVHCKFSEGKTVLLDLFFPEFISFEVTRLTRGSEVFFLETLS